ncbi:MAG: hypothetical protein OES27_01125 [Nitrosopumilus sp.]|nr:hypothetical protein [Nitrosopumilus sp.]
MGKYFHQHKKFMSFQANVFSRKELAIIIGISVVVSAILLISYMTGR